MIAVTHFMLHPDGTNAFVDSVKKVNDAIKKTNASIPPGRWYQLVNRGEVPHFVLVNDRANWAAFQPPDKTVDQVAEEAYGTAQGDALLSTLRKTIRSVHTEVLTYRPDLSYVAGKQILQTPGRRELRARVAPAAACKTPSCPRRIFGAQHLRDAVPVSSD